MAVEVPAFYLPFHPLFLNLNSFPILCPSWGCDKMLKSSLDLKATPTNAGHLNEKGGKEGREGDRERGRKSGEQRTGEKKTSRMESRGHRTGKRTREKSEGERRGRGQKGEIEHTTSDSEESRRLKDWVCSKPQAPGHKDPSVSCFIVSVCFCQSFNLVGDPLCLCLYGKL